MSTISITATVEPTNVPPRVRLDVSASPTTTTSTTITRLDPDGSTVPVRTSDGNPLVLSSGIGLLYDYESPFGAAVSYSSLESPLTFSAQVTVPSSQVWLVHPGVPALSLPVSNFRPGTWTKRTAPVARGVFQPMGRVNPIVITDGARKGIQSSMTVLARSVDEAAAIEALVSDSGPLLLNIPANLGYTMGTCYVSVGDIDYAPVTDKLLEQWQDVTMPFVVVDRPVGGSQSERTLADVYSNFASLGAVRAAYTDLTALLAGP